jgi:hypothetical protein
LGKFSKFFSFKIKVKLKIKKKNSWWEISFLDAGTQASNLVNVTKINNINKACMTYLPRARLQGHTCCCIFPSK